MPWDSGLVRATGAVFGALRRSGRRERAQRRAGQGEIAVGRSRRIGRQSGDCHDLLAHAQRYEMMQYRFCGQSGLKLPALTLGLWHNFGNSTPFPCSARW